jgi:PHD/YefM family antitoxin component YafN of YafNO toxin-antitoxin module
VAKPAAKRKTNVTGHEKFIVDDKGKRVGVVLDIEEYEKILDELDELDAIRAYDEAKASGEEAIPLDQALREIERKRR